VLLSIALLLTSPSLAADDVGTVVKAVESKYSKVDALEADFVQTTKSEVFGEEKQNGQVVLKRPKKMFWDFAGAQAKQFVTDGHTMWVYNAADKQVIKYDDVGSGGGTEADALLTSLSKIDEMFTVVMLPDDVGYTLQLAPHQADGHVKMLRLELSPDYVVERVVITDSFDNITDLAFANVKLNVDVPDSKFEFSPPPGVEVVSAGG
jgi:outer membrane lipoprotein carrier protein